jgi:hypothetical protein
MAKSIRFQPRTFEQAQKAKQAANEAEGKKNAADPFRKGMSQEELIQLRSLLERFCNSGYGYIPLKDVDSADIILNRVRVAIGTTLPVKPAKPRKNATREEPDLLGVKLGAPYKPEPIVYGSKPKTTTLNNESPRVEALEPPPVPVRPSP